jgi:hypothetical protein
MLILVKKIFFKLLNISYIKFFIFLNCFVLIVTETDTKVEKTLIDALKTKYPTHK